MTATKRPVNLTLSEDLVKEVKTMTNNVSGVVESLLIEFVAEEKAKRAAADDMLKRAMSTWNSFADEHGSFADEHSTL
ncbi:MAG: type II toxin-antitoxin system CcdA family antitoxin [Pseudomonadales bacterium]